MKPADLLLSSLIMIGALLISPGTADDSPIEWFTDNGKHYGAFYEAKSWYEGQKVCQGFGGNLASFHDNDTLHRVFEKVNDKFRVWIGLHDPDGDRKFTWVDNSPVDFEYWDAGEPNNNGDEGCVIAFMKAYDPLQGRNFRCRWNDENCGRPRTYLCQVPLPRVLYKCDEPDWFSFEDSCYHFGTDLQRWKQAGRICQSKDAHLVSILTLSENAFIAEAFRSLQGGTRNFWMGMRKTKWADGSFTSFEHWSLNEPNIRLGDDGCAAIDTYHGTWYNKDCDSKYGYVCKKDNASIPSSPRTGNETKTSSGACPENFFSVGHTNKCFYLGGTDSQKLDLLQSKETCSLIQWSHTVSLASIGTPFEQDVTTMLLSTLKDDQDVWIGLFVDQGRYYWNDNKAITYALWDEGQPNDNSVCNDLDNCVSIIGNSSQGTKLGKWKVDLCSKRNAYLCQTTKDDSKTPTGSLTTLPGSPPPITCPDGYNWFKSACFSVKTDAATWEDARATCQNEGGDLASMLDASEAANINFNMHLNDVNVQCWIGLRFEAGSFKYVWTDGSAMTTDFWQDGQPNMYHEADKCVAFKGSWDDRPCTEKKPFVCQQKRATKAKETTTTAVPCVNSSAYGGYCYVARPDDSKTWPEAVQACQAMGMQLVSLHSVEETAFVQNLVNGQAGTVWSAWTGLVNEVDGFRWNDRSPFDFEHWSANDPSFTWKDEDVECVEMLRQGHWNDAPCNAQHGYVCKAPQVRIPNVGGSDASTGPTGGALAGIVIAVVVICAVAAGGFIVYRKRFALKEHSFDNFNFPAYRKNNDDSQ